LFLRDFVLEHTDVVPKEHESNKRLLERAKREEGEENYCDGSEEDKVGDSKDALSSGKKPTRSNVRQLTFLVFTKYAHEKHLEATKKKVSWKTADFWVGLEDGSWYTAEKEEELYQSFMQKQKCFKCQQPVSGDGLDKSVQHCENECKVECRPCAAVIAAIQHFVEHFNTRFTHCKGYNGLRKLIQEYDVNNAIAAEFKLVAKQFVVAQQMAQETYKKFKATTKSGTRVSQKNSKKNKKVATGSSSSNNNNNSEGNNNSLSK